MYVIRKKFKFEMAHRLMTSWSACCQQLHGHSYILEVFLKSKNLNKDGMVLDFGELKERIQNLIEEFDHALVLCETDSKVKILDQTYGKIILVSYNPTAECMCKDFYDRIKKLLYKVDNVSLLKVRIHETDTGYAEYEETHEDRSM